MDFTWDPRKNAANAAKHGIAFRDAIPVFEQPTLQRVDDRRDHGERHIISARRASHHERQAYWQRRAP